MRYRSIVGWALLSIVLLALTAHLDGRLAYLLLRLALGIDSLFPGAVRLPTLGAFAEGLVQQFTDTPRPIDDNPPIRAEYTQASNHEHHQ